MKTNTIPLCFEQKKIKIAQIEKYFLSVNIDKISFQNNEILCEQHESDFLYLSKNTLYFGKNHLKFQADDNKFLLIISEKPVNKLLINTNYYHLEGHSLFSIDLLYAYAYKSYLEDMQKNAFDMLNYLGDKHLLDHMHYAFTKDEKEKFQKYFWRYLFKDKIHYQKIPSQSYLPNHEINLFDLLKFLIRSKAYYYPEGYDRISVKVEDDFNCFKKDETIFYYKIDDLVLNQDRLNVSIRFIIPGIVKINPKAAKKVNLPLQVNATIFRSHTIVLDGALNMRKLKVKINNLNDPYIEKIKKHSLILDETKDEIILDIDLSFFPIISNQTSLSSSAQNLLIYEIGALELEVKSKVINYILKSKENLDISTYNKEQTAVLMEHGLNHQLVYTTLNAIKDAPKEVKRVREFKSYLKGFSSFPAVKKVIKKSEESKTFSPAEELIYRNYILYQDADLETLYNQIKFLKSKLTTIKFQISAIKLSLIYQNTWLDDLVKQKDGSYLFESLGHTLIIRLERKDIYL